MESQTSTYSNKKYSYQILDSLSIELEITYYPFRFPLEELFVMAARRNKKRSFLFVSKILGKHLPIPPVRGLLTGSLLADIYTIETAGKSFAKGLNLEDRFMQGIPVVPEAFIPEDNSPVIIGFAETATALGQSFFAAFKKADYFHTTREAVAGESPVITFEEEHSHATSHRCYIPKDLLDNTREIILVDDEMSTGKTAINIISSIQAEFPRKVYTVVSILDWRSPSDLEKFSQLEKELGITIRSASLLRGTFTVTGQSPDKEMSKNEQLFKLPEQEVKKVYLDSYSGEEDATYFGGKIADIPYAALSGRFGMDEQDRRKLDESISALSSELSRMVTGKRVLAVGTGEFMYIPMKIASLIGGDIRFQSTTRSPIHVVDKDGYGARYGMAFPNPEDHEIQHYLYNVEPFHYDEAMIFFEREVTDESLKPLLEQFRQAGIPSIKIVFYHGRKGNE
ncbi:phosphoribosyltransferase family protein [Mesobacillus subterraneus]|uniref:Adenine/guanine phosphoribosyltransferase n=1 Tax=Mesobacillus subterraneus TaxID=285983 RepID=A0A3R9KU72_9BACI|nr:phosphoribosyltransferase family protein [Mesobacillus subterraneus]RSD26293.1 hypothetical protein EJA10_15930 [Mesobacillus subterraneus]